MQSILKKTLPHLLVFVGFIILSLAYFSPVLQKKEILQSDIVQYNAMAKQQRDFKAVTGKETYWTNSAFGGMPTYQLGARYANQYIKKLDLAIRFLPRPADYLFLYFIGFYILLLSLKVDFKLAALGALAFGFSTYLIIILGVGHNSKAHAIAYMPLVLSGIVLTFQGKYSLGFIVTAVAMGLELVANHFQMTYYLLLLVLVLGTVYLIDAYKKRVLPHFFKSVGILFIAVILAIGLNAANIMATQEYAKESTRGKSELTINPNGSPKTNMTSGLTKAEITEYSYGGKETFNLFIPTFLGGGMRENVGEDSAFYNFYIAQGASPEQAKEGAKSAPLYWGEQPIVEAPAYVGAVIIFLFVLALFLVKGRLKWWLVSGTVLALLLSYGKNFSLLTDFFIDFVPLYDKFRAVTSIQVILELCIPVLAIFGLVRLFNDYEKTEAKLKALKYTIIITAGFAVLFILCRYIGIIDFIGPNDGYYRENYGKVFLDAILNDRKMVFTRDTFRSLLLVLLSGGVVYLFLKHKLSELKVILIFGVLIIFDQVGVDRRYVNTENFVASRYVQKPFQSNAADKKIFSDSDDFRVFDRSSGTGRATSTKVQDMTSGALSAPYFHNTINGYHAAKLKRFDNVYDFYIQTENRNVLNMLNTRYIIADDPESNQPYAYFNQQANGNAWFVKQLQKVGSANEEILALEKMDAKNLAVYTSKLALNPIYKLDSLATIDVVNYEPDYIKYKSSNSNNGFAVFSEVYYSHGWKASVDGKSQPIHRVNYILRGLEIPKGIHTVEFKFDPEVVKTGNLISLVSSILLLLLILGVLFYTFKQKNIA